MSKIKGVQFTGLNVYKRNIENNPFSEKQSNPINKPNLFDSVELSSGLKNNSSNAKLFFAGHLDNAKKTFENYKNFFGKKYNESVNFTKNVLSSAQEKISFASNKTVNLFSQMITKKPDVVEELSQKPVDELKEMLVNSLNNIA